jgi:uncharacterized membrane protein YfcA
MDPIVSYAMLAFIILFASFVRGASGFGLAMTAMPLLNLFMPYLDTVILAVYLNLMFSVFHLIRSRGSITIRNLILTIIFGVLGVTIGVIILKSVDQNLLKTIAGLIIIIFGFTLLSGFEVRLKNKSLAFSTAALTGGILAGSASIGGPAAAIILGGTDMKQDKFRYAMSVFFLITYLYSAIMYGATGLISIDNIKMILFSVPFMAAGLISGDKIAYKLNSKVFHRMVLTLLIITGSIITYQGIRAIL